jgi:hypothetical protein
MMKFAFVLAFAPALLAQTPACVIKVNTVGPIKAGMTIRAARLALPGSVWKQQDDPGGSTSYFAVMRGGKHFIDIYPNQEDGIKETSKVELMRVFDPACVTAEGVHAGMPLIEVEGKFGNLKKLILEPSEKREYAQFEKQPNWLEIQAGSGEAGMYNSSELCSHGYKPDAKVESVWVSHPIEHGVLDDDQFCKVPDK